MDTFTRSYIETMLWSSTDESNEQGGSPLDETYSIEDLAPKTLETIHTDCQAFQTAHHADINSDLARAGHDFWLTRNRHGAGFWDGDWPAAIGDQLTAAAHAFGELNPYVVS